MSDNVKSPEDDSTLRHSYFVGVLERVREVLKPRMPASVAAATTSQADEPLQLSNIFSSLTVYEPAETADDLPADRPPVKLEVESDMVIQAEPQTSLEDALAAYAMMVMDLNKTRAQIRWIWANHRQGVFDAAAASIATNSAVDLARNLIEEVLLVCKDYDLFQIATRLYGACCIMKGFAIDDVYLFSPRQPDHLTYDVADEVYMNVYNLLRSLRDVLHPRQLPLYRDGMYGVYDADRDRDGMSGKQKLTEDQILLFEIFTELVAVNRAVKDYPIQDEFVRGIGKLEKTGHIPFYLVFAAQVYLDIHHVSRADATYAFDHMMEEVTMMGNVIDKHLESHNNLKVNTWSPQNDEVLRQLRSRMLWISRDPVYKAKVKAFAQQRMPVPATTLPNRILRSSPVLAGLMLYHFRAQMYEIGITAANAWGSIAYTWHLYNALDREKMLQARWKDMDVVYGILGGSSFHIGEAPKDTTEYFSRFCVQMGVTTAAFTDPQRRRRSVNLYSRAGPRGIKDGARVSNMFMDRYCRGSRQFDWSAEHLDSILARSNWNQASEQDEDGSSTLELVKDGPSPGNSKDNARMRRLDAGQLKPESVIESLVFALQAETVELAYPYLIMHITCWELLREVKSDCDRLLRAKYTPAYMERESELPWVVGYILQAASGIEGVKDMRLLQEAAEPFNDLIASVPDSIVKVFSKISGIAVELETERVRSDEEQDAT